MAEPMSFWDKVFYIVSGTFLAVFGTSLWLVFVDWNLRVGIPLAAVGVLGMAASLVERISTKRAGLYTAIVSVFLACTWTILGFDIYAHYQLSAVSRTIPEGKLKNFKDELAHSPNPGRKMHVLALGSSACGIANTYKDIVASSGWIITEANCLPLPLGLEIRTQSADHSAVQASDLRRALENQGLHVGWSYNPTLQPDEFELLIGVERDE